MFKRKITYPILTLLISTVSTTALASGYHLSESSITGMGRSFAGVGVNTDDISGIAYNPAGINFVKKGHVQVGIAAIEMKSKFRGVVNNSFGPYESGFRPARAEGKIQATVPSVFAAYRLSENAVFGLGVFAPFGLRTSYSKNSPLNVHAIDTEFQIIEAAPTLSYRLAGFDRKISIGVSVGFQYSEARLTSGIDVPTGNPSTAPWVKVGDAKMKGDTNAVTMSAGINYDFTEKTRVGLGFRSSVTHELEGKLYTPSGTTNAAANLTLPSVTTLSAMHEMDNGLTLSGSIRYTGWSRFKEILIMEQGTGEQLSYVYEKWRNSWTVSGGLDYTLNKYVTLRTGLAFEQTPIERNTHRTARIPDGDRILLSVGATFNPTEAWSIDVAAMKIFVKDTSVNHAVEGEGFGSEIVGVYKSKDSLLNLLGVSVQYKF